MVKKQSLSQAKQSFISPEGMPFLEIRTTMDSTLPYAEHLHSGFSFGLILHGSTSFFLDGAQHMAKKGDMVFIAPWQSHCCNPVGGQARSYHMFFLDCIWLMEKLGAGRGSIALKVHRPVVHDPALFEQAKNIVNLIGQQKCSEDDLLHLLKEFIVFGCFSVVDGEEVVGINASMDGHNNSSILNVLRLPGIGGVGEQMGGSVRVQAKTVGMRRESYSRAVKRITGLPPRTCRHCIRLEEARKMLRLGKSPAEAAQGTGYADQSHFHRMLVKFFATTPGCYQKNRSHSFKK